MHDEPFAPISLFWLYLCLSLDANHLIAALGRSFERLPLRISARWANLWVYPCIHLQALVCLTWFSRILYIRPYLTMWFAFSQLILIVLSEIPCRQSRPNPVAEFRYAACRMHRLRFSWILHVLISVIPFHIAIHLLAADTNLSVLWSMPSIPSKPDRRILVRCPSFPAAPNPASDCH
jgi:hypothetical protein